MAFSHHSILGQSFISFIGTKAKKEFSGEANYYILLWQLFQNRAAKLCVGMIDKLMFALQIVNDPY